MNGQPSNKNGASPQNSNPYTTVGADLSRPAPIYRPSGKSPTSPHPFVKPRYMGNAILLTIQAAQKRFPGDFAIGMIENHCTWAFSFPPIRFGYVFHLYGDVCIIAIGSYRRREPGE